LAVVTQSTPRADSPARHHAEPSQPSGAETFRPQFGPARVTLTSKIEDLPTPAVRGRTRIINDHCDDGELGKPLENHAPGPALAIPSPGG